MYTIRGIRKAFKTRVSKSLSLGLSVLLLASQLLIMQPANATAETSFTIAQVPDTQNEMMSDANPLFSSRYQWLVDNESALNLKFIVHTGDVVNWGVADPVQFTRANAGTTVLDNSGIPYSTAIGNHDTAAVGVGGSAAPGNTHDNLRDTTAFNQTFSLSRFRNVGGVFEAGKVDNMYQTFTAGGNDWLVLTLEMWPRQTVIDWAKEVVTSHPQHNVIVSTHAYTDNTGALPTTGNYGDKNALVLWQQLISQYANIKMVLSGHYGPTGTNGGYNYSEATGVNGNKVTQIMTAYHANYQNHVRLLNINTVDGTINSSVYVPTSTNPAYPSGYITDGASNFVTTNMQWQTSVVQPPVTTAPSAPLNTSATAGNASATVSFSAPTTDGGSPITGYTVVASPGGLTAAGSSSPITVPGLTNGTSYTFTVTAANGVGISPTSAPTNAVTPSAPVSELLSDPGFESGNGGFIAFNVGTLTRVTSPTHGGSYALKVGAPTAQTALVGLTQNSVVTNSVAGKQYTFQCYVRATTTNLNLTARFLEYTQNYSSNIKIGTVTINSVPVNTWTLVKVTGTATASGKRIIPQIYSSNQTSLTGYILYDDCSVTRN